MKKIVVLTLIILCYMKGFSQTDQSLLLKNGCSRAKFFKQYLKESGEIKQSHLLLDYDVKFYHLNLNVEDTTTYLSGNVIINSQSIVESLDTFAIELIDEMNVDSVLMDDVSQTFFHHDDQIFVPLPNPIGLEKNFSANIYYHGTPPPGDFFTGVNIDTNETWNTPVVWTLSEPFNARQWFPVKQVLDDKADSVWVFLTTTYGKKAGSQGLLVNEVPLLGNKIRYEWKSSYPIAYYLISFAVANYQDYSIYAKPTGTQDDSILIQNYIYNAPGCLEQFQDGIDRTTEFMELFSNLYSLYPFYREKYGHCLAEIHGGMENQTMTTLNEFGYIVAHELAHSWFGDNVTCSNWSDIWVNEGFATYSDYLAHEKIAGGQWPAIWLKQASEFVLSEPGGSVFIPKSEISYDNVDRIFDGRLTYYKGALILHMMRFEVNNDDLFFHAFRNFQEAYANGVASGLDFLEILNQTTGHDFTEFFDEWYFGEGYPIYNFEWSQQSGVFEIYSTQASSMPDVTPFFHQTLPIRIYLNGGNDTTVKIHQTQATEHFTYNLSSEADSIVIDPDFWMLEKVSGINGIHDFATNSGIVLSPNPAKDFVFIQTGFHDPFSLRIFDLSGKTILEKVSAKPSVKIDVKDFTPGVCLVKIKSEGRIYTDKFIKY